MKKTLVAIHPKAKTIWAIVHAINLAIRIGAKTFILFIQDKETEKNKKRNMTELQKEIAPLLELARIEGIMVDTYISYGEYAQEIINFVRENGIDLLILGVPAELGIISKHRFFDEVEKIRQMVDCRIQLVNERKIKLNKRRK